jgi:hydrogenase small subunit
MTPFYRRLPQVPGAGVQTTADQIGGWIVGGTAVAFGAHALVSAVRAKVKPLDQEPGPKKEEEK